MPEPEIKRDEDRICEEDDLCKSVAKKEDRKVKARREGTRNVWFGLGMFGLIGWSVAVPTLIGIGIGVWIDSHYQSQQSWTLMLLLGGIILGCINAWYWLQKEGGL